jgi:hypothetical protein
MHTVLAIYLALIRLRSVDRFSTIWIEYST